MIATIYFLTSFLFSLQLDINAFVVNYVIPQVQSPLDNSNLIYSKQGKKSIVVYDQRWNREIEENSRKKAQSGGMGETVAGAVLGSLVLGPFGRLCFRSNHSNS